MSEPFNNLAEALHRTRGWKWFATTDLTGAGGWTEPKETLEEALHEALKWPDRETPSEILVSQGRRATKADYEDGLDEGYAWTIPAEGHFQVKLTGYWRAPWAERQKPTQGRTAKP